MISSNGDYLDIKVENFAHQSSDFLYVYVYICIFIADPEKCALNIMYAQWVDG